MNTTLKWVLGTAGGVLAALVLVGTGVTFGQMIRYRQGYGPGAYGMMSGFQDTSPDDSTYGYGPGMMRGGMMGDYSAPNSENAPYGYGMMGGYGMMSNYNSGGSSEVAPLSVSDAQNAIEDYLTTLGNADLELEEVLIFDQNAYGLIVEKSTGMGAMEVLVDPVSKAVYPEPGPNMMWNRKYSPMGRNGMMNGGGMWGNGMMNGWQNAPDASAQMPVSLADAVKEAQSYLDTYLPGTTVEDGGDTFYGYYTLETMRDGKIVGMLSVNGYTGQVFIHTWHGNFIESSETDQ